MARNPAGSGTIRKKTVTRNGKTYTYWEARYTTGTDSGTGKQVQKSITGKTQREVARKLKEATAAIDTGVYVEPEKLTLAEWLDIWQKTYLTGVKDRTADSYRSTIRNHLGPGLGAVRMDQLDPHRIQQYINGLMERDKPLSPKTVKNIHGVLHAALRQAAILRYIPHNPADNTTLPRRERKEMNVLDETTTAAFLKATEGHKYELLYKFTLFTGLREGEVMGLTWDRVSFDKGTVLIDRQLQKERKKGGQYRFVSPKNDKPRTIRPAPYAMALLKTQKARQAEQRLKAGELWENRMGLVFTNETGGCLKQTAVYTNCRKIMEGIGLQGFRFHDLRHSFAVASLRSGDDVKTLQANLGHHSAAFTLDQYGHVTEQMKQASADRMEAYIKGILEG